MRKIALAVALVAAAFAAELVTSSQATAPGKNGRIAFRRYFDNDQTWGAVFTINSDGSGERQVTRPPRNTVDEQPDWSPDGSVLVFSRCSEDASCGLFTIRGDGTALTRLTQPCAPGKKPPNCEGHFVPTFSPDGRRIAFGRFSEKSGGSITVVDRDGGNLHVIVTGRGRLEPGEPQFSPDGKRLVFQQIRQPGENVRALFVANADGSGVRQLTPWRMSAGDNPDWSPDGRWILFRSYAEVRAKQSQIYIIHPNGTGLRQLTHFKKPTPSKRTIVTSSSFSPDGKSIVFGTSGVGPNADLYVMRRNGSGIGSVTRTNQWESAPDWGPRR